MNVEERKLLALATIVAPSVGLTQLKLKVQREGEGQSLLGKKIS